MKILGIESSCDDTAAAVISDSRQILSSVVWSQLREHLPYGGVVPEIAARSHLSVIDRVIEAALQEAHTPLAEIDLIAVTAGPGLIGGVMVGLMTAKALSLATGIPFIGVNHLAGHALTTRLSDGTEYPYLMLLVSGGHCQWLAVQGPQRFTLLGATRDDALGEAFDKTAKMLGLPYPGGPAVEALARAGDAKRFPLPVPMQGQPHPDFSFSGLKTALRETIMRHRKAGNTFTDADKADLCAAFQHAAGAAVTDRLKYAIKRYEQAFSQSETAARRLVVAGGVAANQFLRQGITDAAQQHGFTTAFPPVALCTDNAAMIAWAGYEQYMLRGADPLTLEPKARWPLDEAA